ncbi:MAG: polyphosphate kinase 1 [Clostridia bacterium]
MGTAHKRKKARQVIQNRELSWLQFNRRVQAEADNPENPLLERAKFLAIVTSNLDEFMQVRYVRVMDAARDGYAEQPVSGGLTGAALCRKVNREILRQHNAQYLLYEGIRSELFLQGIQLYPVFLLEEEHLLREREIFDQEIRPNLKVLRLEDSEPMQKQLYLCVKLQKPKRKEARYALVALPATLPRLFDLSRGKGARRLIRVEEIVKHYLHRLFPKEQAEHAAAFRILRNQNFLVQEQTEEDIVPAVREMLSKRRTGAVMRLEAEECMSEEMLTLLMRRFHVGRDRRYRVTGPLDLNKLMMNLYSQVKRAELKYPSAQPVLLDELMGEDVFERIDARDYLLYHPYHSFAPVVHLMRRAAVDPTVRAVKQTLYRVSGNSPIVTALVEAAQNGKQVTVLMEAHARFDEESNLFWGERLARAGCRVLYGLPNRKVHSKITLIEREAEGECHREVHLGTGNYHDGTAKLYTDFGLLTADEQLTADAAAFFEQLEGRQDAPMEEIIKAPERLHPTLLQLIDREREHAQRGANAWMVAKMNSLSDGPLMHALIDASRAGVRVELIVRGICCLLPGCPGVTENVHISSIVGRHLEHARAFVFQNGGEREVYLSSADWMPRNLYRRVELMFPVKDARCKEAVENVLALQLVDTQKRRLRRPSGAYARETKGLAPINAQEILLADVEGVFAGRYPPAPCKSDSTQIQASATGGKA